MLLLLAFGCTSTPLDDSGQIAACAEGDPIGTLSTVAEGLDGGTEGVAFSDGRLFVSVDDGITELLPDGSARSLASTGHALGLAPAAGGLLLADPGEFTFDGSGEDGRVLHVAFDGTITELATGLPNPNFVTGTPWGTVLVSDDTNEILWEIDEDGTHEWATGIPSPNGLAFSPDGSALYVVSTFTADPPLWRIPVEAGLAGTAASILSFPSGSAPDGLAVDESGQVLVALNLGGSIVSVDPVSGASVEVASGLSTPASLAFGAGGSWDACAIYVSSLYSDTVSRISLGTGGAALSW